MPVSPFFKSNFERLGWRHCLKHAKSPEEIKFIIKNGGDANSPEGAEALFNAASDKRSRSVEALLKAGAPTSHQSPLSFCQQGHALLVAVNRGCPKCVKLLLPVSDLSVTNRDGRDAEAEASAFAAIGEPRYVEIHDMVLREKATRACAAEAAQIAEGLSEPSKTSSPKPRV